MQIRMQPLGRSYDMGVNAFVTNPATFGIQPNSIGRTGDFWFEIVKLPRER